MKAYYMGKKNKAHRFCPECSSSILIDFQNSDVDWQRPLIAVNVSVKSLYLKGDCAEESPGASVP